MLTSLLRPFSYLSIRHVSWHLIFINWIFPFLFSTTISGLLFFANGLVDVFSVNGLFAKLLGFIQTLPGFYLAALAAIATFDNPDMGKLMPGAPPVMNVVHNGVLTEIKLSRRRFLTSMFAFLTASSILLTLMVTGGLVSVDIVKSLFDQKFYALVKLIFSFCFFCIFFQLLTVTLWGLFYLGERIHTPD